MEARCGFGSVADRLADDARRSFWCRGEGDFRVVLRGDGVERVLAGEAVAVRARRFLMIVVRRRRMEAWRVAVARRRRVRDLRGRLARRGLKTGMPFTKPPGR